MAAEQEGEQDGGRRNRQPAELEGGRQNGPEGGRTSRRAWPVRVGRRVIGGFWAALVSGEAEPAPLRPSWRTVAVPRWPGRRLDLVVAAEILTTIGIFAGMLSVLNDANDRSGDAVGQGELLILAAAAASVPLLLRDRWPLAAWRISLPAMVLVAQITDQATSYRGAPEQIAPPAGAVIMYLLILYAVGVRCPRHVSAAAWVISVVGMGVLYLSPAVVLGAAMTAVPLLFGYNVRVRRQAQRRVVEEERRTEGERAARAVLAERSRIARELHDVVAHHMSVIAIQAEAAPIKAPADPEVLKAELAGIRATALEALAELRRILGVLRDGGQAPATTPQPDLSGLDQLLASFRAAGAAVTVTTSGQIPATLGGAGLAAYRILQESLSNALRHAPGAPVRVHIAYHPDRLELRVANDPPPRAAAPLRARGGQGLAGMRERVGTYGGTLTTGPTPEGGFAVVAVLPAPAPGGGERA